MHEVSDQSRRRNTYPWPLWYNSVTLEMEQTKVTLTVGRKVNAKFVFPPLSLPWEENTPLTCELGLAM